METDPVEQPSSRLLRDGMNALGMTTDLELSHALSVRLPRGKAVSQLTVRRWLEGSGIPDRMLLAICATLPGVDFSALALALATQAASRAGTMPVASREW